MSSVGVRDRMDRLAYWPAFAVCLALASALALRYRYLPMVDWPEHCSMAAIWSHRDDPTWKFDAYYSVSSWFRPYHLFRVTQVLLAKLFGDSLGFRAALLVYLVGMPLAAQALVVRLGRDRWVGLGAFTVLYEANMQWGFAPFITGITLLLLGLVVAIDALRDGRWWRYALLAAIGLALFFTHPQVTAMWAAAVGLVALVAWLGKRASFLRAGLVVVALLPGFLTLCLFMFGWVGESTGPGADPTPLWDSPLKMVHLLPYYSGLLVTGELPVAAYLLALGALAITAMVQARLRDRSLSDGGLPWSYVSVVLIGLWTAMIFVLPTWWRGEPVSIRIVAIAALTLLWLPRLRPPSSPREAWLLAPARVALLLAALGSLGWAHVRFSELQQSMAPVDKIVAMLPPTPRVAALSYSVMQPGIAALPIHMHDDAYLLISRGGMTSFAFEGVTPYKPAVPRNRLLVDQLWYPSRAGWQLPGEYADYYDYVFVITGRLYRGDPFQPIAGKQLAKRVFAEGRFELWQINR